MKTNQLNNQQGVFKWSFLSENRRLDLEKFNGWSDLTPIDKP
jgi:hypothetical protein